MSSRIRVKVRVSVTVPEPNPNPNVSGRAGIRARVQDETLWMSTMRIEV